MKKLMGTLLLTGLFLSGFSPVLHAQKIAIYNYPVEIELTNDQGDMPDMDYLKNYGTKGKKRGAEFIYETVTPFLIKHFTATGMDLLSVDTLNSLRANDYDKPSSTLKKAVATGIADQYMKVYLKDITLPVVEGLTQQDRNSQVRKVVKMRCRIQIYDANKELLKDVEGEFQSGEKIEDPSILGVDLRKYQGSAYLQEMKIYETCTKMAILRAIARLSK